MPLPPFPPDTGPLVKGVMNNNNRSYLRRQNSIDC